MNKHWCNIGVMYFVVNYHVNVFFYWFLGLHLSLLWCHNPLRNNLRRHQRHLQANDGHRVWLRRNGAQEERHLRRRRWSVNRLQLVLNIRYSDDHNPNVKKGKLGKLAIQVFAHNGISCKPLQKFSIFGGRRVCQSAFYNQETRYILHWLFKRPLFRYHHVIFITLSPNMPNNQIKVIHIFKNWCLLWRRSVTS